MKKIPALLVGALMVTGVCSTLTLTACSSTQSTKTQIDDSEITTAPLNLELQPFDITFYP